MHPTKKKWSVIFLLVIAPIIEASTHCEQKWDDIKAPHNVADNYHIHLLKINTTEEYRSFMPNTKYQVLVSPDEEDTTFIRFYLTVENENKSLPYGTLELYDDEVSEFSQDCPDSVVQISQIAKDEVSVYWTSPEEGSGCVIFRYIHEFSAKLPIIGRVSIMESPSRWFMDGSLEQKYCQDPKANVDDPGPVLPECCACDEAKYELAFEGLWSRYTHPKNFPTKPWSARFSDVVGASHTSDYRFWEYDGYASEGLKQVAENGLTRILESELKNQSEHIRTIIKARGINFPNITSKTFAVFRVDQQHHLMSLVSMIDPSPDWFIGVSGLELCLTNCSWVEYKELNLYPIDAGTDDGITYEAVDSETQPRDIIRRITTTWPEDERSPFYDPTAIDMNPLAKLYLKRQRIYEKNCDKMPSVDSSEGARPHHHPIKRKACRVTAWGPWESCSVTCGRGVKLRQRAYKNEKAAAKHNCDSVLTDRVLCYSEKSFECPPNDVDEKKCPLTNWSTWSKCSKRCGPENRTRDRNFKKKRRKECRHLYPNAVLQQTVDCDNPACDSIEGGSEAEGEETVSESTETTEATSETAESGATEESTPTETSSEPPPEGEDLVGAENRRQVTSKKRRRKKCVNERYTDWSLWTPCSVSCGTGTKSRSRQIKPKWNNSPDADKDFSLYECQYETTTCEAETTSCEITKDLVQVICSQPEEAGYCADEHNDNSLRYFYDRISAKCVVFHYTGCNGNMNNFRTLQECQATCKEFQDTTPIRNYRIALSSVISYNTPFRRDQQASKTKQAKCDEEKDSEPKRKRKRNRGETKSNEKVDCKVSEWSDWSPCYSCKGYRTMSRDILVQPREGGKPCPSKLMRRQKCHKVLPECEVQINQESNLKSLVEQDPVEDEVSVHCRVSPWESWSACTRSCGISQRRRIRNVVIEPRGKRGKSCPSLTEIEDCRLPSCQEINQSSH